MSDNVVLTKKYPIRSLCSSYFTDLLALRPIRSFFPTSYSFERELQLVVALAFLDSTEAGSYVVIRVIL